MQSLGKDQDCDSWETQKRHGDIVNGWVLWRSRLQFQSIHESLVFAVFVLFRCLSGNHNLQHLLFYIEHFMILVRSFCALRKEPCYVRILLGVVFSTLKSDMEVGPGYCACVWT